MSQGKSTAIPDPSLVLPHYQPIISMDSQLIVAYEVLGRIMTPEGIRSLGPFFQDPNVSMDDALSIDRIIRQKALSMLSNSIEKKKGLFFNIKPAWIYMYRKSPDQMPTLQFLRQHKIDPSRVTIEITEDCFYEDIEELARVTRFYREAGCKIAIDDVGSGFINFDRIAYIKPNILKLDLELVKKCAKEQFFYEILTSFAVMAEKIGAFLLFEGIETEEDVQLALSLGARYMQGYYFAKPQNKILPDDTFEPTLNMQIQRFVDQKLWQQHAFHHEEEYFQRSLSSIIPPWSSTSHNLAEQCDFFIQSFLKLLPKDVIRVYLCDERGLQYSSNFMRNNEAWCKKERFQGYNWAWRPYFLNNIVKVAYRKKGKLSTYYTDAHCGEKMRTYIHPVSNGFYLCLDISDR
ncbi:EAL domain-containing protein [Heliorestis acidaminivorans]|uniref:EAL domain-containing protein n=1 Tax=Heliorestis acidaminivorans TaxID=553427 RepID=A0A6I0ETI1_9FIRM|nr:EAL domain-containing protein [Heliorestis acidaminivorans]KAB2953389.1 EAL domain-containing protein [Heliorestis acidaminivorans]